MKKKKKKLLVVVSLSLLSILVISAILAALTAPKPINKNIVTVTGITQNIMKTTIENATVIIGLNHRSIAYKNFTDHNGKFTITTDFPINNLEAEVLVYATAENYKIYEASYSLFNADTKIMGDTKYWTLEVTVVMQQEVKQA